MLIYTVLFVLAIYQKNCFERLILYTVHYGVERFASNRTYDWFEKLLCFSPCALCIHFLLCFQYIVLQSMFQIFYYTSSKLNFEYGES